VPVSDQEDLLLLGLWWGKAQRGRAKLLTSRPRSEREGKAWALTVPFRAHL
jgi:hypothetical protein